ncbi:vWA domain-containing protein [Micromonospora sp. NPDC005707]|uniref:vWA domain-containing protein n=1 Tax=unclassified Micromonospora TaxID=2617518 RepID=UPI0033F3CB85
MSRPVAPYSEELATRLAAARVWAAHRAPYLANAVFSLVMEPLAPSTAERTGELVADPEFAAFPTDTRWVMHVDPGTALTTPVEETGWWILHQIGHLVRGHAQRSPVRPASGPDAPLHAVGYAGARDEDAHRWNQAADAEINDDLEAEELAGPAGVISPPALGLPSNRLAEEYLPMLDELVELLRGTGRDLSAGLDCGSGADGIDRRWDSTGAGGLGELERELLERSVAVGIQERVSARSEVPMGWQRWAEERLRPRVDWRARVGSLVRKAANRSSGRVDYSYRRPSRRSAGHPDIITPQLVRPVPDTVLVLDTSGSVRRPQLDQLVAEVAEILAKVGRRRLRVICCDLQAHPVQEIRRVEELRIVGGGGTDMRAGLAAATELRPRPDLVVVLTDGHTPWPDRRPPFESLVCLVGDGGEAPDWASSVHIPEMGATS